MKEIDYNNLRPTDWLPTSVKEMKELEKKGWIKEVKKFNHINTSKIGLNFFIPEKRNEMVEYKYLIKI